MIWTRCRIRWRWCCKKNELFSGTIKDNLRWGDESASDEEIIHACMLAQAAPFIQTFPDGYNTYIEQSGTNVSGGQKQRLCIARALLKKPKILILDDSTSAVDTKTDALMKGRTVFVIAHRLSTIRNSDAIMVLDQGCITERGNHEELLKKRGTYYQLYTGALELA